MMNEFNEYVRECFSEAGDIVIKSMMGGYLVYFKGKLIGDICGDELFLKRTPTSDRLLADSELRYPYEGQDLAAQIAVETVEMWLAENPDSSVKKVVFNVFGNKDLEIYKKVLGQK